MPKKADGSVFVDRENSPFGIKFKWDDVWDAGPLTFKMGVDFGCSVHRFQNYCHVRAMQMKMKCRTKKVSETEIVVEFTRKPTSINLREKLD